VRDRPDLPQQTGHAEHARQQERLFIAVPLPDETMAVVQAAQDLLPGLRGLRRMSREQLHVTLAFIGAADRDKRKAAEAVVKAVPKELGGSVGSAGFLFLPSQRRPRVVAIAFDDKAGVFGSLFERVMGDLEAAGVMQREKRPFHAHLTIARLREPVEVQPKSECPEFAFRVESVCLYRSDLSREGARYAVLAKSELEIGLSPEA
jgi:RNA 2',3'-cyclic 3'-phosphodiesterase